MNGPPTSRKAVRQHNHTNNQPSTQSHNNHNSTHVPRSRSTDNFLRPLAKQLSNRILHIHAALARQPRRRRLTLAAAFLAPAALFVLLVALASLRHFFAPRIAPYSPSVASAAASWLPTFPFFSLVHDQLQAPDNHFKPPSLFAPDALVRRFDRAWRLRAAVERPSAAAPASATRPEADPSPPVDFARVAYAIQASGDSVKLLPRLLSRIHDARNLYVLHIDAKTADATRRAFEKHVRSHAAYARNVHVVRGEMLTYKGISAVVNSLSLMATALRLCNRWHYYINLSASDYPLVAPQRVAALLARPRVPLGTLNYVWFFPRKEWKPYSFRTRFSYRDPATCGHQSPRARLFHMAHAKTNPLDPSRAWVFTKAEAWSILSRPFVEFVARSGYAKRMLLAHQHVLSVSEHLVTDILFNHPVWRATVVPEAFRKVVWYFRGFRSGQHPYTLDKGPEPFAFWPDLEGTRSLFARKFAKTTSPVMDRIDERLSGLCANRTGADPATSYQRERDVFYQRIVSYFDSVTQKTLRQQGVQWPKDAYPPLP